MFSTKILVVEDEEIVAFDIETTLQSLGYEVVGVASSGEEALEKVNLMKPHLVLMDIRIKGEKDGIQVAEEIWHQFTIPIVYLTANADSSTLQRATITEPFGYLLKPFEEKELQTTIEIALARHRAEMKMREALDKERELNEMKSKFIAITTHEFRTPMTAIRMSTDLLERYCQEVMDEKKSKHFQRIKTSIQQMLELMEQVLVLSKSEAGQLKPSPKPLDLEKFCINLVEEFKINSNSSHHLIFNKLTEIEPVYLDENILRYILSNLFSNAIKYSPEGTTIRSELLQENQMIVFRVQDLGIGIPSEDIPRLFQTFHRASNVGTIQGTGLGLSIVKNCIDLQGGEIQVNSEVGKGTTFTIKLPLNLSPPVS